MKKLTEQEVVELLRQKHARTPSGPCAKHTAGIDKDCRRCNRPMSANRFADEVLGITAPYLSEIYRGTRRPGEAVLDFLGLERHTITETYYSPKKK